MPLKIETFSNVHGGNAFFKAVSHPMAAEKAGQLYDRLKKIGSVAIYDPIGQAEAFTQFYDLKSLPLTGVYVQDIEQANKLAFGQTTQLITAITSSNAKALFITAFDTAKMLDHIRHLLPAGIQVVSFDDLRLPAEMLTDKGKYLSPLNFATNFVFFRDTAGHHTRLITANYWGSYGARDSAFFCRLYDENGKQMAEWQEKMGPASSAFIIDSKDVRAKHKLGDFTGHLFVHAINVAGHDIVKYALDTYGDKEEVLSCTHDANSWPSDYYAGLPAPDEGEDVVLWVQNSMPIAIPAGEIGINVMGSDKGHLYDQEIAPFATKRLSVAELGLNASWPQQLEVNSGKYFVRPRYEVFHKNGHQRIAHVNVERSDLKPDPQLPKLGALMGKGHILPAPILPVGEFDSFILPTPMSRGLQHMPIKAVMYDSSGVAVAEYAFGNLPRSHASLLDVKQHLANAKLPTGYGHVELMYDFNVGEEADGWLHGLFRYIHKPSGHAAESSFGSHIFNTALVYKNEPQSYVGRPPGLSTRLFLRVGHNGYDTMCHLIYPASTPWHKTSDTALILTSAKGEEIARTQVKIACSGSHLFRVSETFAAADIAKAGEGAYVTIRDTTCRLFGYHGLLGGKKAFSLDHMFGF